ncbi:MAG: response regulator transcription factor [Caldilineaceae bacterium]|nr:response regulator transcription factor [Caldilineaceae bacterium]
MTRTRIFIIHENQALANQAIATLTKGAEVRVMDALTTAGEALAFIGENNCDAVLVSSTLPQDGAIKVIKTLRRRGVKAKVIVTGLEHETNMIVRYIASGAAGYALREEGVNGWLRQIQALQEGRALLSKSVVAALMSHLSTLSRLTTRFEPKAARYGELTEREIEVFRLLAAGESNQSIADTLIIGVGTVKNHVHNILKKLNLRNRKEAATYLSFMENKAPVAARYM